MLRITGFNTLVGGCEMSRLMSNQTTVAARSETSLARQLCRKIRRKEKGGAGFMTLIF